jgi:hypothetical protein
MAPRFSRGAIAYAGDGRSYTVDDIDNGIVYCSASNGTETEFPEAALLNEAEWHARSDGRRDVSYSRLKQSRAYTTSAGKLDRAACDRLLAKIERLSAGLLDFAAFSVATRTMEENGDRDLVSGLSIVKCRTIFDAVAPDIRVTLLAGILATPAGALVDAGRLGDNLMRAMLEKGLAAHSAAFESFRDRRRR